MFWWAFSHHHTKKWQWQKKPEKLHSQRPWSLLEVSSKPTGPDPPLPFTFTQQTTSCHWEPGESESSLSRRAPVQPLTALSRNLTQLLPERQQEKIQSSQEREAGYKLLPWWQICPQLPLNVGEDKKCCILSTTDMLFWCFNPSPAGNNAKPAI